MLIPGVPTEFKSLRKIYPDCSMAIRLLPNG